MDATEIVNEIRNSKQPDWLIQDIIRIMNAKERAKVLESIAATMRV